MPMPMNAELGPPQEVVASRRRKTGKGKKAKRSRRDEGDVVQLPSTNVNKKMRNFLQQRAARYNSDDEDETTSGHNDADEVIAEKEDIVEDDSNEKAESSDGHDEHGASSEEDEHGTHHSFLNLAEGSSAFRKAFTSIMEKSLPDQFLGPVLSGRKNLIAKKLAEEAPQEKVKVDAKKEKKLVAERGHVKPESFLDAKEMNLLSIARKGVVKLFNDVNKAQAAQKSRNASRTNNTNALRNENKANFLAELRRASLPTVFNPSMTSSKQLDKSNPSGDDNENDGLGWAVLRDSYMLSNPDLRNWDKASESVAATGPRRAPLDSSSDEE